MKTIVLKTCETAFEAHLIKHQLENEGISCFIANEHFTSLMPHYYRMLGSGVQIHVYEHDLEQASEIITNRSDSEKVTCPNCGSSNITFGLGRNSFKKWIWVAFSLLMGVPFNNLNNRYLCKDCQTEFKGDVA